MKAALLVVVAMAACSGRNAEPSGVGSYTFTMTTLGDVKSGDCQPTKLFDGRAATWCFGLTPIRVGNRSADTDLYFLGAGKDAKLIEIQLVVRGCVENDLEQWMRSAMGPPRETRTTREYWSNSYMWVAAFMPSEPGRCLVHFLPLEENAEIERIKAQ